MSDEQKVYAPVAGFVQFDPEVRTLPSGDTVQSALVVAIGSQQKVNVDLFGDRWPNVQLQRGDFIAAEGEYSSRTGQNKTTGQQVTYHNVRAFRLVVNGVKQTPAERQVVQQAAAVQSEKAPF